MVPNFGGCKKQVLIWFHFVWTTFVHCICLRSSKRVCMMQLYNLWFTHPLEKLPNFSFDFQRQQLDLISFCDARFSVHVCAIVRPVNEASAENVVAPRNSLHKPKVSQDLDVQEEWSAWRAPRTKLQEWLQAVQQNISKNNTVSTGSSNLIQLCSSNWCFMTTIQFCYLI